MTAIRESMEIIQANGADLAGVLVAIDRQEKGKGELSAIQEVERDFGCAVISIVSLGDLVTYLEEKGDAAEHLEAAVVWFRLKPSFKNHLLFLWPMVRLRLRK